MNSQIRRSTGEVPRHLCPGASVSVALGRHAPACRCIPELWVLPFKNFLMEVLSHRHNRLLTPPAVPLSPQARLKVPNFLSKVGVSGE